MGLEIDIRSVSDGSDPALLTQKIREVLASGRVRALSWTDSDGNRRVRVDVFPPQRDPERE